MWIEDSKCFIMSSSKEEAQKEFILSVIDQLRRRKARPDLQRITHFVDRKHGLSPAETEAMLEKLVDQGHVIKVVYKRGTSYRNAAKSRRKSYGAHVLNSNTATRRITEAVQSLTKEKCASKGDDPILTFDPEDWTGEVGVSAREIECWVAVRVDEEKGEPFMCPIHLLLEREVEAGRLDKLQNGNYIIATPESDATPGFRHLLQKSVSMITKRGRPPKKKVTGKSVNFAEIYRWYFFLQKRKVVRENLTKKICRFLSLTCKFPSPTVSSPSVCLSIYFRTNKHKCIN